MTQEHVAAAVLMGVVLLAASSAMADHDTVTVRELYTGGTAQPDLLLLCDDDENVGGVCFDVPDRAETVDLRIRDARGWTVGGYYVFKNGSADPTPAGSDPGCATLDICLGDNVMEVGSICGAADGVAVPVPARQLEVRLDNAFHGPYHCPTVGDEGPGVATAGTVEGVFHLRPEQGTCSNTGNNRIRITQTPDRLVPHDEAILRMTDAGGNVWLGTTGPATPSEFAFRWSGTQGQAIQAGDLVVVEAEPTSNPWDNSERLEFDIVHKGDPVAACPFTWVE